MPPTKARQEPLASVIVLCCDQLEHTRRCIAALMRHTRAPWELITVDNGSTDGTATYLAGVRDAAPVRVEVLQPYGPVPLRPGASLAPGLPLIRIPEATT